MWNLTLKMWSRCLQLHFEFVQVLQFLLCQITYNVCTKESQDRINEWIEGNRHNTGPFLVPGMPTRPVSSEIYFLKIFFSFLFWSRRSCFHWWCSMALLQPEVHIHPSLYSGWRGRICRFGSKKACNITFWFFLSGHPVNVGNHLSVSERILWSTSVWVKLT